MTYKAFDLSGRVAVVTGGNAGIGLGFAEALAQSGADITVWGTNQQRNAAACERLARHGRRVIALACDVGDEQAVDAAFGETVARLGRVDACYANAGIGGGNKSSFVDMTSEDWHRVLRVNLDGAFYTLRAAARHMTARGGGGSLVATASLAAIEGAARNEHYAATKGALVALVKALAVEFARDGIRANAILPGWIETDMTRDLTGNERFRDRVLPRIPMRRWGRPDDFGGIAVYLASDASQYHTGDSFLIDGGYAIF